jgi:dipeptidyl aminopeptidase/acylaminoacyl peptidase
MGFSYGGYLSALALARSSRFRAGVCGCPVFDLESWLHTSEISDPAQCGFADVRRATLDAASPSSVVERIEAPLLLLHGERDLAAPVAQSDWMYRALARRGREVGYVRYPGAAHRLMAAPEHQVDVLARVADWFARHLGDPAGEPPALAAVGSAAHA